MRVSASGSVRLEGHLLRAAVDEQLAALLRTGLHAVLQRAVHRGARGHRLRHDMIVPVTWASWVLTFERILFQVSFPACNLKKWVILRVRNESTCLDTLHVFLLETDLAE